MTSIIRLRDALAQAYQTENQRINVMDNAGFQAHRFSLGGVPTEAWANVIRELRKPEESRIRQFERLATYLEEDGEREIAGLVRAYCTELAGDDEAPPAAAPETAGGVRGIPDAKLKRLAQKAVERGVTMVVGGSAVADDGTSFPDNDLIAGLLVRHRLELRARTVVRASSLDLQRAAGLFAVNGDADLHRTAAVGFYEPLSVQHMQNGGQDRTYFLNLVDVVAKLQRKMNENGTRPAIVLATTNVDTRLESALISGEIPFSRIVVCKAIKGTVDYVGIEGEERIGPGAYLHVATFKSIQFDRNTRRVTLRAVSGEYVEIPDENDPAVVRNDDHLRFQHASQCLAEAGLGELSPSAFSHQLRVQEAMCDEVFKSDIRQFGDPKNITGGKLPQVVVVKLCGSIGYMHSLSLSDDEMLDLPEAVMQLVPPTIFRSANRPIFFLGYGVFDPPFPHLKRVLNLLKTPQTDAYFVRCRPSLFSREPAARALRTEVEMCHWEAMKDWMQSHHRVTPIEEIESVFLENFADACMSVDPIFF